MLAEWGGSLGWSGMQFGAASGQAIELETDDLVDADGITIIDNSEDGPACGGRAGQTWAKTEAFQVVIAAGVEERLVAASEGVGDEASGLTSDIGCSGVDLVDAGEKKWRGEGKAALECEKAAIGKNDQIREATAGAIDDSTMDGFGAIDNLAKESW